MTRMGRPTAPVALASLNWVHSLRAMRTFRWSAAGEQLATRRSGTVTRRHRSVERITFELTPPKFEKA